MINGPQRSTCLRSVSCISLKRLGVFSVLTRISGVNGFVIRTVRSVYEVHSRSIKKSLLSVNCISLRRLFTVPIGFANLPKFNSDFNKICFSG